MKMKNLLYIVLFFAIVTIWSCDYGNKPQLEKADSGNDLSQQIEPACDTDEIRFSNVDTIFGFFRRKDMMDTLVFEKIDNTFRLMSPNHSVSPLEIRDSFTIYLYVVQEGDLDGNGTDEIGIRREPEMGNWNDYEVYTYRNNKWYHLLPPIMVYATHFYDDLHSGQDVVTPAQKKGYVKVQYSGWVDENIAMLDTIVKTILIPSH